jgi:uncharacterized protein YndB with AHSA1/START domain
MRYAQQPGTEREIRIAAEPSRVWEVVADVEAMTAWSPELRSVEWQGDAKSPAVGARYVGHNEHPVTGKWQTVSQFTEVDPGRSLAWCVLDADGHYGKPAEGLADRTATWSFTLTPDPEGSGTVLRQSATMGPGRSGLSAFIERSPEREEEIVAFRLGELGKGMEATLNGTKARAEGLTGS